MSDDNDSEEFPCDPIEFCETVNIPNTDDLTLPAKSKGLYEGCYKTFSEWRESSQMQATSESVLMAYFEKLAKQYKPSTLWSHYSMLKTTIRINEKLDIGTYRALSAFMKEQSQGFESKKSKVFTSEEVRRFLLEAPDDYYLLTKVVLIFGIAGSCRKEDLTNIKIQDIETHGALLLVKIQETKTAKPRSFTVGGEFCEIVKKYISLRPPMTTADRFFLNFRKGKCTTNVVGKNKFGYMPKEVASYLKLPDIDSYTGHCFRRTSASVFTDTGPNMATLARHGGWTSNNIAEVYSADTVQNKSYPVDPLSTAIQYHVSNLSEQSNNYFEEPTVKQPRYEYIDVGRSITRTMATSRTLLSQQQQPQRGGGGGGRGGGEKYVDIEETRGVRRIQLSHQKTRNSLSLEMMSAILQNLAMDAENPNLRSIVISAAPGNIFSAGHNLKELRTIDGEDHHRSVFETCAQLMKAIAESPVPVIAAVDGLAAAAGCQLIAACDIVVCTERSSFSTPGVNFGIFCSTPGIPLIRNVPRKVAAHMLFTGLPISAQEAYQAGLVSKIVPVDMFEEEINKITDAINEKSRSVVRLGKRFIQEQIEIDADTAYSLGTEIMVNNLKLKDAQEGIRSFSEKRRPSWTHGYDKEIKDES